MAARYWRGGTGKWDDTNKWSTTSGGTFGASVPTSADDVIFDANSGTGPITVYISQFANYNATANSITVSGRSDMIDFDFYSGTSTLTVTGGLTVSATSGSGGLSVQTSGYQNATFGGSITHNSGYLWFSSVVAVSYTAPSNTTARSLGGDYYLTASTTGTPWNITVGTGGHTNNNLSVYFTAAIASGVTRTITHRGTNNPASSLDFGFEGAVGSTTTFTAGTSVGKVTVSTLGTWATTAITLTGLNINTATTISGTATLTFNGNGDYLVSELRTNGATLPNPIVITGILNTSGNSVISNSVTLTSGTLNISNNTLTCTTFSSSNSNVRSIVFGTTGRIDLSSTTATTTLLTLTTATNLTVSGTPTIGIIGAGTQARNINTSNGYSTDETTAWNYVVNTTGGSTVLPAFSRNVTLTSGAIAGSWLYVYGSLTYTAGTLPTVYFRSTGSGNTVTGSSIPASLVFEGVGGTWTLSSGSSTTAASSITLTNGNLSVSNRTFTTGTFSSSNSNIRSIAFGTTGRIDLSSTTATTTLLTLTTATNLTISGTPTIGIIGAGTQARVITNGYSVSEATAWDYRVNTTGGSTTLPTYTRTVTQVAGSIANATLSIYGGYVYTAGTVTSAAINFIATSGTWPLTFTALPENLVFNGVGGTWQVTANCSTAAANTTTLTNGTLSLNDFALETGTFASSNSNIRTIAFGTTGRIDLSGSSTTGLLDITIPTNLSVTGTPTIGTTGSGGQSRVITNGYAVSEATAWNFRVNTSAGSTELPTYTKTLSLVAGNLNGNIINLYGGLSYTGGNWPNSSILNFLATSGIWPISATTIKPDVFFNGAGGTWQLQSNCTVDDGAGVSTVTLTQGTLDLNEFRLITDTVSSSNTNIRAIDFGTAGQLSVSTELVLTTYTNLTYIGNKTLRFHGNTANVGITISSAIDEASAWNLVSESSGGIDITGTVKTLTMISGNVNNTTLVIYGGFVYTAGSHNDLMFAATSGTWPITLNATNSRNVIIEFNGAGGTWQLTNNATFSGTSALLTLTAGTLDLNEFVLSVPAFVSSNSNIRAVDFGAVGRIDLVDPSPLDITNATNFSVIGTPTIGYNYQGGSTINILNGYSVSEATAWDYRINCNTSGTIILPSYTRTLTFIAGVIGNTTLNLYGGFIWTSGTVTSSINFIATSGTWPLSFIDLQSNLRFNGVGGTWQLTSACSIRATNTTTVTNGTLSLNTFVLTVGLLVMDGGTIAYGTSNIVVQKSSGTVVDITGGTTTGTPVVNVTSTSSLGSSLTCTIPTQINVTNGTGIITLLAQVHSVAFTGTFTGSLVNAAVNITGNLTLKTGMTVSASANAMTFNGTSGTQIITPAGLTFDFPIVINTSGSTVQLAAALTQGATRSMTLTAGTLNLNNFALSTGTFSSSNTNTRVLAFGTTGSITLSAATTTTIWNSSTTTNFTTTGTTSVTAANAAGAKTINTGDMPEASAISFSILTPDTVTFTGDVKNLTLNNASLVFDAVNMIVFGNFTTTALSSFASDATPITFAASSGTQTVTTAAKTINSPIVVSGASTVTLGGALTTTSSITLTSGTFNAATYAVTITNLLSSNTNTRSLLMGTGQWTLTGTGTVWDLSTTTGLTFTKSTSTLVLSDTSTSARTFAGGSLAYNAITIGGATGTSTTTFTGSNTFTTFASTKTVAHTLAFTAGTTTTVTSWTVTGTSGNIVTLQVSGSGTYTLAAGATAFQINFMSISNCTATSSPNVWYASRSTDGGGNTGINFFARPLFWIAGTGTWDGSTVGKWSYTSGGASAGIVPVSDCDVTFDANSDSAAIFTVTVATGATCRNLVMSALQFTMTFAGTGGLTIYGSMTLPSTLFTRTYTGDITFGTFSVTDSTTRTITLNGQTLASSINFGSGHPSDIATWTLGSAFITTSASGVTLTRGNLSLSTYTLTTPIFASSNSNARTINFGTGKIVLTSAVLSTIWDVGISTNFAVSGTPLVEVTSVGTTVKTINTGQVSEAQAISFSILGGVSGSTVTLIGGIGQGFKNLTILSLSTVSFSSVELYIYGNLRIHNVASATPTFNGGTLVFAGTTGTQTINIGSFASPMNTSIFIGTQTGAGGSNVELLDLISITGSLNIYRSFNANTYKVEVNSVSISGAYNPTVNMGSNTWDLKGTGLVWSISGNGGSVTLNSGTSTILLSNTSTSERLFFGGVGYVYNNFVIGGTTGSSTLSMYSSATFNTFSSTKTVAHTILFQGGSTNTFTNFTVSGTAGNIVTIGSTDTTQATLSKPTVWYVGANSVNGANNKNLIFSGGNNINYLSFSNINGDPPVPASSGFFMFCS